MDHGSTINRSCCQGTVENVALGKYVVNLVTFARSISHWACNRIGSMFLQLTVLKVNK